MIQSKFKIGDKHIEVSFSSKEEAIQEYDRLAAAVKESGLPQQEQIRLIDEAYLFIFNLVSQANAK